VEGGREGGRVGRREGRRTYLVDVAGVEADGVVRLRLHVLEGQVIVGHLRKEGGRER